jgi:hypothetical protein
MCKQLILVVCLLSLATAAGAQSAAPVVVPASQPAAAPQAPAPAGAVAASMPEATEFKVRLTQAISSRTSAEGDAVPMVVAQDVAAGGHVFIKEGTPVRAVVSEAHRSGRMGRGGQLSIQIQSTTGQDQQRIPLRSAKSREGANATGSTVALTVLFGPLGLLKRGHEATYPSGTEVTVYTDAPVTMYFAVAPARPVVVSQ